MTLKTELHTLHLLLILQTTLVGEYVMDSHWFRLFTSKLTPKPRPFHPPTTNHVHSPPKALERDGRVLHAKLTNQSGQRGGAYLSSQGEQTMVRLLDYYLKI